MDQLRRKRRDFLHAVTETIFANAAKVAVLLVLTFGLLLLALALHHAGILDAPLVKGSGVMAALSVATVASFLGANILGDLLCRWAAPFIQSVWIFFLNLANWPGYRIKRQYNCTTLRTSQLDKFIKQIYVATNGDIFLHNPDIIVFREDGDGSDGEQSVKNVLENLLVVGKIKRVDILIPQTELSRIKMFLKNWKAEARNRIYLGILDATSTTLRYRYGIYRTQEGGKYEVEYFLYRPKGQPYGDELVLITERAAMSNISGSQLTFDNIVTTMRQDLKDKIRFVCANDSTELPT